MSGFFLSDLVVAGLGARYLIPDRARTSHRRGPIGVVYRGLCTMWVAVSVGRSGPAGMGATQRCNAYAQRLAATSVIPWARPVTAMALLHGSSLSFLPIDTLLLLEQACETFIDSKVHHSEIHGHEQQLETYLFALE